MGYHGMSKLNQRLNYWIISGEKIPYEIDLCDNAGGTMIDYDIPFESDSE